MTEHRERMEKALRGCGEAGVPETVDLWPTLREQTATRGRHKSSRFRIVPRTRAGWAFAVLAALFVMTGARYAASGLVYARFQEELPGAEAREVGTEIGEEQVIDGTRVTLGWAYADEEFVVISYSVKNLEDRRNAGQRVQLEPVFVGKEDAEAGRGPSERATLTHEGGRELGMIDGTFEIAGPGDGLEVLKMAKSNSAVFEVPKGLEPGQAHRFHLEIPLEEMPTFSSVEEGQRGGQVRAQATNRPVYLRLRASGASRPRHRDGPEGRSERDHGHPGQGGQLAGEAPSRRLLQPPRGGLRVDAVCEDGARLPRAH